MTIKELLKYTDMNEVRYQIFDGINHVTVSSDGKIFKQLENFKVKEIFPLNSGVFEIKCDFETEKGESDESILRSEEDRDMNKLQHKNDNGEIVTIEQAAKRVNIGTTAARKYAKESGAMLKLGRSLRVDMKKFVDYLSSLNGEA